MPTARRDISARSYSCMNGRERLAASAGPPSSSSPRASAPRTGARPASAEQIADTSTPASIHQSHALAARIGGRVHLAGGVIPGDDLHIAPLPPGHLERMSHGLQLLDLRVAQRALFIVDFVGQVLMMVVRVFDDVRRVHAVQIIE